MFILKYLELRSQVESVVNVTTVTELKGIKIAAKSGCICPETAKLTPMTL